MFLTYSDDEVHTYQLRAYIFQARDLYGLDQSGLSDPYGILSFNCYAARTTVVKESVTPTWDQTLWIENIKLFGNPEVVQESPPMVYIEFFDKDIIVSYHALEVDIVKKWSCTNTYIMQVYTHVFICFYEYAFVLQGSHEFLGFMKAMPTVRLNAKTPQPRLDWYPIIRYTKPAGELLAAFELILVS